MVLTSAGPGSSPQHENCTGSNQIGGNLRSTQRWNDVPRGTMDEVSSYVRLNLPLPRRQGRAKDCSTSSSNPMMEGPWCRVRREARAGERHRRWSWWIALKVLDPRRPIREADISSAADSSLFDHLVSARQECLWDREAERLDGRQIDDEFELGRLLDWKVSGFRP